MIHLLKTKVFILLLLAALFSTCKKKEIYPEIPSIEYKKAVFVMGSDGADSVMILTFSFKDGNGDIGLSQEDTLSPYDARLDKYDRPTNPYYHNLRLDYYESVDGIWQQIIKELDPDATPPVYDTLMYQFRIENITPEGRHKAIRGDIDVTIYPSPQPDARDTVMYKFYIYDRALNKSNVVESPPIIWTR